MSTDFANDDPVDPSEEIGLWDDDVDFDIMSDKEVPNNAISISNSDSTPAPHTIDQLMNNDPVENTIIEHKDPHLGIDQQIQKSVQSELDGESPDIEQQIEVQEQQLLEDPINSAVLSSSINDNATQQSTISSSQLDSLFDEQETDEEKASAVVQSNAQEQDDVFTSIAENVINEQVPATASFEEALSPVSSSLDHPSGPEDTLELHQGSQVQKVESSSSGYMSKSQPPVLKESIKELDNIFDLKDDQDFEKLILSHIESKDQQKSNPMKVHPKHTKTQNNQKSQEDQVDIMDPVETDESNIVNGNINGENNDPWSTLSDSEGDEKQQNDEPKVQANIVTVADDETGFSKVISDQNNAGDGNPTIDELQQNTNTYYVNIPSEEKANNKKYEENQNSKQFDAIFSDEDDDDEFLSVLKATKKLQEEDSSKLDDSEPTSIEAKPMDKFGFLDDDDESEEEQVKENMTSPVSTPSIVSSQKPTTDKKNRYIPQVVPDTPAPVVKLSQAIVSVGSTSPPSAAPTVKSVTLNQSFEQQKQQVFTPNTATKKHYKNASKYAPIVAPSVDVKSFTRGSVTASFATMPSALAPSNVTTPNAVHLQASQPPPSKPKKTSNFFQDAPILTNGAGTSRKTKAELKKQKELIRQQKKLREQQQYQSGLGVPLPMANGPPPMVNGPPPMVNGPPMNPPLQMGVPSMNGSTNIAAVSPMISMTGTLPTMGTASPMKSAAAISPINSPQQTPRRSFRQSSTASKYAPPQQPQQPPQLQKGNLIMGGNPNSASSMRSSSFSSQQNDSAGFRPAVVSAEHHHPGFPYISQSPQQLNSPIPFGQKQQQQQPISMGGPPFQMIGNPTPSHLGINGGGSAPSHLSINGGGPPRIMDGTASHSQIMVNIAPVNVSASPSMNLSVAPPMNRVSSITGGGSFMSVAPSISRAPSMVGGIPLTSPPTIANMPINSPINAPPQPITSMNNIQSQPSPRLPIENYLSIQIPIFKFCNHGKVLIVKNSTDSVNGNAYLSMSSTTIEIKNLKDIIQMDKSIVTYPIESKKRNAQNLSKWISEKIKSFEEGKDVGLSNSQYDQENILLILRIFKRLFESSPSSNNDQSIDYKTIATIIEEHFGFNASSGFIGGMRNNSKQLTSANTTNSHFTDSGTLSNLLASLSISNTLELATQTQDFALSLLYSGLFKKESFMSAAENYVNRVFNFEDNDISMLIYFFFKSFINIGVTLSSLIPIQVNFLKTYWFQLLSLILQSTNESNISIVKNILIQYSKFFESINYNHDNRCQINYILAMVPVELVNFKSDNITYIISLDIYAFILERTGSSPSIALQSSKKFIEKSIHAYIGDFESNDTSESGVTSITGGWFGSKSKIDLSYQFNKFISGEDAEVRPEASVFDKIVPKSNDHPKSLITSVNNASLNPLSPQIASPFTPIGGTRNMRNALLNHSLHDNSLISPPIQPISQFAVDYAQRSNSSPNITTFSPSVSPSVSASPVKSTRTSRYANRAAAPPLQPSASAVNLSARSSNGILPASSVIHPSTPFTEKKNLLDFAATEITSPQQRVPQEVDNIQKIDENHANEASPIAPFSIPIPITAPPAPFAPSDPSTATTASQSIPLLPPSSIPVVRHGPRKGRTSRYMPTKPSIQSEANFLSQYQNKSQNEALQGGTDVDVNDESVNGADSKVMPPPVFSESSTVNNSYENKVRQESIIPDNLAAHPDVSIPEDVAISSIVGSRSHSRNNSLRSSRFNPVDSSSFANISDMNGEISFSKTSSTPLTNKEGQQVQDIPSQYSAFEPVTHDDIAESLKIQQIKDYAGSVYSEFTGGAQPNINSGNYNGGRTQQVPGYSRSVGGRISGMFDDTASLSRFRKAGSISSVGTSNYISTYRQDDTIYEEDDDEMSEDEEELSIINKEKRAEGEVVQKKKVEHTIKRKKENDNLGGGGTVSRKSSGWFDWLGREKAGANGKKIYKAKLGEENSFYYDETLKRWINKKIPIEEQIVDDTPPPPPKMMKKPLSTRSAPAPSIGGGSVISDVVNDLPAISEGGEATPSSNNTKDGDAAVISTGVPIPSIGYASAPGSTPSSRPKKIKHDSLEDLLNKSVARKGGKKTRKARGYVNVMQN